MSPVCVQESTYLGLSKTTYFLRLRSTFYRAVSQTQAQKKVWYAWNHYKFHWSADLDSESLESRRISIPHKYSCVMLFPGPHFRREDLNNTSNKIWPKEQTHLKTHCLMLRSCFHKSHTWYNLNILLCATTLHIVSDITIHVIIFPCFSIYHLSLSIILLGSKGEMFTSQILIT